MSAAEQTKEKPRVSWNGKPVPQRLWGKDHHTTLLYLETRCVDYGGQVDPLKLRRDGEAYPSALGNGTLLVGHNDYDCIADFEDADLLRNLGTGLHPVVELTEKGWQAAWKLRRERAYRMYDRRKRPAS